MCKTDRQMDGMIWGLWHFKHTQIVAASCFDSTDFVGILAGSCLLSDKTDY